MREMCNDFIVDSTTISLSPTGERCCNNQSTCTPNNQKPTKPDNGSNTPDIPVMDCNRCVIERIGLAQAFVPFQPNANAMEPEQALVCGTAFPDLSMPYVKGSDLLRR